MDNFDLRKYLAEGKLLKEDKPVWTIEGEDDSPTIESSDKGYKEAVVSYIKSIHPNISDKDLKKSMEVAEETWYNEGRENAKSGEGEDFDVSVEEFADGAVEYYEDVNDITELKTSDVNVQGDKEDIMMEFIKAVEKSSNSDEIFEKFENWVNSFLPGAIKEDLEQAKKDAIEGVKDYADRHAANMKIYMDALMKYDIGSEEVKKAKLATEKGLEDLEKELK